MRSPIASRTTQIKEHKLSFRSSISNVKKFSFVFNVLLLLVLLLLSMLPSKISCSETSFRSVGVRNRLLQYDNKCDAAAQNECCGCGDQGSTGELRRLGKQ